MGKTHHLLNYDKLEPKIPLRRDGGRRMRPVKCHTVVDKRLTIMQKNITRESNGGQMQLFQSRSYSKEMIYIGIM